MTRNLFTTPFFGFEEAFSKLENIQTELKKYSFPPYNIKKIDENKYLIELALAGITKNQVEITLHDNKLTVSSVLNSDEDEGNFLYKGISMRNFSRTFAVADTIEVNNAEFVNGLLRIFLENYIPEERKPKKIEIKDDHPAYYPAVDEVKPTEEK